MRFYSLFNIDDGTLDSKLFNYQSNNPQQYDDSQAYEGVLHPAFHYQYP